MTNSAKDKGDNGEREVKALLQQEFASQPFAELIDRELGAGRKLDRGDIARVPTTAIQVTRRKDTRRAIIEKLDGVERQRQNKRARYSALFMRWDRGPWIVVLTPQMWVKMWLDAYKWRQYIASRDTDRKRTRSNRAIQNTRVRNPQRSGRAR